MKIIEEFNKRPILIRLLYVAFVISLIRALIKPEFTICLFLSCIIGMYEAFK